MDFAILAVKSCLFGVVIAVITCYHGLAQPLRLEDVSRATIEAVAKASLRACCWMRCLFLFTWRYDHGQPPTRSPQCRSLR